MREKKTQHFIEIVANHEMRRIKISAKCYFVICKLTIETPTFNKLLIENDCRFSRLLGKWSLIRIVIMIIVHSSHFMHLCSIKLIQQSVDQCHKHQSDKILTNRFAELPYHIKDGWREACVHSFWLFELWFCCAVFVRLVWEAMLI